MIFFLLFLLTILIFFYFKTKFQKPKQIESFESISLKYGFDLKYGYYIPYSIRLSEKYDQFYDIYENINKYIISNEIDTKVQALPNFVISPDFTHQQLVIFYSLLQNITAAYIQKEIPPKQSLPPQLAIPFYEVSTRLGVHPSFSMLGHSYGWYYDENKCYMIQNFTGTQDENFFFLASVISGVELYHLLHIFYNIQFKFIPEKNYHEINLGLESINNGMIKILERTKKLFTQVKPEVFWHGIRKFTKGFGAKENFPNGGVFFEGVNLFVNKHGGSGGQDPSFQMFENAMGFQFETNPNKTREKFKSEMAFLHREFIDFWKSIKIRSFIVNSKVEILKNKYNKIVENYKNFHKTHANLTRLYIEEMAKEKNPDVNVDKLRGAGNTLLPKVLHKWIEIEKQYI